MKQRSKIACVALLAFAGTALAQGGWTEVDDDGMLVEPLGLTVDDLEDADLYGPTGERIGEVDDVLRGDDGSSMAVSLDVGGFLGIGEKNVIIPLEDLSLVDEGVSTGMTKDELETLPEYDD